MCEKDTAGAQEVFEDIKMHWGNTVVQRVVVDSGSNLSSGYCLSQLSHILHGFSPGYWAPRNMLVGGMAINVYTMPCDGLMSHPGCILPHSQCPCDRLWIHCNPDQNKMVTGDRKPNVLICSLLANDSWSVTSLCWINMNKCQCKACMKRYT